jgi:hypothetical protein
MRQWEGVLHLAFSVRMKLLSMRFVPNSVRLRRIVLVLIVGSISLTAGQDKQDKEERDRVRAKEPSTVTVYGRQDRVEAKESERKGQSGNRAVNGLKNAAAGAWNGIISFGGWLLNTDDDIPSERERRSRSEPERQKK